jgi:hypothetical protein
MKKHLSILILATLAGALNASTSTAAERLGVTCTSSNIRGDVVTCGGSANYAFESDGEDIEYTMVLKAPPEHCSKVQYVISANGRRVGQTAFLDAGEQAEINLGDGHPEGRNSFKIRALGKIGGCNNGQVQSWGVLVDVGAG